jgi:hypothetical protein
MKLHELEDADQIVTREYLDTKLDSFESKFAAKLAELETRMTDRLIASERGQRLWIWGLYGLVIVSYFIRH